jgi:hypothetical protein
MKQVPSPGGPTPADFITGINYPQSLNVWVVLDFSPWK